MTDVLHVDPTPPAAAGGAPRASRAWLHLAVVALAALAAYSNSFAVPFQFDDGRSIVENPAVRSLGAFLAAPWTTERPLGQLTFALNGSLGGQSVFGYHAVNLAIHVAAAAVVYFLTLLVARLAQPTVPALARRAHQAALIAALLFALHPIQTQAVTYVVQRFASLAALLYAGAVLAHGHAVLDGTSRLRRGPYLLALLLGAASLLVKENAASLPFAVALWDLCFVRGRWRERIARVLPFLVVTLALSLALLDPRSAMAKMDGDYALVAAGSAGSPRWTYLVTQTTVLVTYLRLLVLPIAQNLDYDLPIRTSLLDPTVLLALAILVVVLGLPAVAAWRTRARSGLARILLFAIGWFFVALSIESSVFPLSDVIAEHRLYLPLVGLSIALGCGASVLIDRLGRPRVLAIAGLAAWLATLGGATWTRNQIWRDPMTLWSDVTSRSPAKSRPFVWLAKLYVDRQDYPTAIALLRAATASPRPLPEAWINLGASLVTIGRPREGMEAYRRALAMLDGPSEGPRGALERAIRGLEEADSECGSLALDAGREPSLEARRRLASCRMRTRDVASAVAEWERLLRDDPGDAVSAYNIGDGYARMMEPRRAAEGFRRFLLIAGTRYEPQRRLAEEWLASHPDAAAPRGAALPAHATPP
jgi:tetratricopeptide (TPR) repeat protein